MNLAGKIIAEIKVEDVKVEEEKLADTKPEEVKKEIVASAILPDDVPDQVVPDANTIEDSIAGLSEVTSFGPLPIIRKSDGLTSFKAYQTPFTAKATTKGVISLVMVDFGLSEKLSNSMLQTLPPSVTFVASPYAYNLLSSVLAARSKTFEIWLGVPMQGNNTNVPPNTILMGLNNNENTTRLNGHLGKTKGYVGIVIDAQSKFPPESPELQAITDSISARGLGIAQVDPNDKIIGPSAVKANAPFVQSKIWIDEIVSKEAILKSLAQVEKMSLENGTAVAAFNPSLFTANVIQEWQKSLESKNIELAPLSYSAKMNLSVPASTVKTDAAK
jgi:polysaccharide deacetylase 2 family uncharacterized protein YibQ